jgi:hypothetical protein
MVVTHWGSLQCFDKIYGSTSKKVDAREAWYWIARMTGLQPPKHRESAIG